MRGTLALPHPIHQATYFSLVSPMSLDSVSRARVAGGMGWAGGGGPGGGGREGRKRVSYPVSRA
jgi:hypothetical protein